MTKKKYIGAYKEVEGDARSIDLALKNRMKSELFNATGKKRYPVHGDEYTGGVAVVEITAMNMPDDMDAFKEAIGADYVSVADGARRAEAIVKDKQSD